MNRLALPAGLAVALALAGCAAPPAPVVAPPPATPAAAPTPLPTPASTPAAAPRLAPLPSPSLNVSLSVDRSSAAFPAGDWVLAAGERVERRRGPLVVAPASGGLRVTDDGAASDWPSPVEIALTNGGLVPWADATYRGRLSLRATPRGTLHVINRVGLEDYLKGVVPSEMGPRVYDEVEALKAQAVAARSYAAKHRGQFAAEGYDLCATPRCQVYSGASAESPLSTRAVEETAGEVLLWKGAVADTLFTSTCGGRTENAPDVMAGYAKVDAPYLASVACFGETAQALESSAPAKKGTVTLLGARGRALAVSFGGGEGAKISQKARETLQQRLGVAAHGASRPHPLSVPAVYLEIAAAAGFDTAVLGEGSEREGLPSNWSEKAKASFAAIQRFQLGGGTALPTDRALKPEEAAGIYAVLLARMGDFEDVEGRITRSDETGIEVKSAKGRSPYSLSEEMLLFSGGNEALAQVASHRFFPGDKVRVFVRDGKAVGVVFPPAPAAGAYDRESAWEHWTRRFTSKELGAKLREREGTRTAADPTGVAVTSRGVSGRARTVAVATAKGTVTLTGLEIRFALGLPENLFNVVVGKDEDGERVFTFYGRGWGHGVGLCQTGAFGMALSGRTYREILAHYYPGTEVAQAP
ncbi:MAG: SpoIID/LytB domain-containing protein [Acidobacteria bacterium]|nr:SpoIID/LytB domain-containing protein [Acidobacteriota bacterium]